MRSQKNGNEENQSDKTKLRHLRREYNELNRKYWDLLQATRYQYHTALLIHKRWHWSLRDTDDLIDQFWCKN